MGDGANDQPQEVTAREIEDVLRFDPFPGEDMEEEQEATPAEQETQETEAKPADGGKEKPAQPATPEVPEVKENPEVNLLKEKLAAQSELIEALRANQGGKDGAEPKKEGGEAKPDLPDYLVNVPDELLAGLGSEDPAERKQAVQYLIQGTAQLVHKTVAKIIDERVSGVSTSVPQMIQQAMVAQTQQKAIFDDFYGKYPELKNPVLNTIIKDTAKALQQEGYTEWNTNFRDALAKKVKETVAALGGTLPAKAEVKPNGKPPVMVGGGSTRSSSNSKSLEQEIVDTLF